MRCPSIGCTQFPRIQAPFLSSLLEVKDVFQNLVFGQLNIHKFNLINQLNSKNQPWSVFIEKVRLAEVAELAEPSD